MKKAIVVMCLAVMAAIACGGCAETAEGGGAAHGTVSVTVEEEVSQDDPRIKQLSDSLMQAEEENSKLKDRIESLEKEHEEQRLILVNENEELRLALEQAEMGNAGAGIETERKFLIDLENLPKDMEARSDVYQLVQTYISYSPEIRVRSVNDRTYYLTLKMPKDDIGLSREEINLRIPQEDYAELVKKQVGETINKTRYQFYEGETHVFVDVYSGALEGLAVAEVEFESVELAEAFIPPNWFGEDVTSDSRYKNASLAKDGMPKD